MGQPFQHDPAQGPRENRQASSGLQGFWCGPLVFEQKRLGNEGTDAARLEQLGQDGDQVDEKDDEMTH